MFYTLPVWVEIEAKTEVEARQKLRDHVERNKPLKARWGWGKVLTGMLDDFGEKVKLPPMQKE